MSRDLGQPGLITAAATGTQNAGTPLATFGSRLSCSDTAGLAFSVKRPKARWLFGQKMIGAEPSPIKVNGAQ